MGYKEALAKAQNLCSSQEKCIADVATKLKAWGIGDDDKLKIIGQLVKEKYIDEERYAQAYANDKFKLNKWGKLKIGFNLKQKGIPGELIGRALQNIESEDYMETIERLIQQKIPVLKKGAKEDRFNKLVAYLYNKGFAYEDTFELVSRDLQKLGP
jgi:regulatory protein